MPSLDRRRAGVSQIVVSRFLSGERDIRMATADKLAEALGLKPRIDFARMRLDPTHFVQRDYRHVESDVVLHAPLLGDLGRRGVTVYILIEHQSEPDAFMIFRVLEYVVSIYKRQLRNWEALHRSRKGFRFQPVLPIVVYSGTRFWAGLGRLVDLVEQGECFADVTPALEPLFLNIQQTPEADLEGRGGFFGWLLRLLQQRRALRPRPMPSNWKPG